MQFVFILLTLLLLAVATFALQNPDRVTLSFLVWKVETSVAILALGATTTGALIAGLLGLASRLRRWQRARAVMVTAPPTAVPPLRPDPPPPSGPPPPSAP
jgi:uncharacterized integral membrane protein